MPIAVECIGPVQQYPRRGFVIDAETVDEEVALTVEYQQSGPGRERVILCIRLMRGGVSLSVSATWPGAQLSRGR